MDKTMVRRCSICGKKMTIRVNNTGAYSGGHFFGRIKIPSGEGKYKEIGRCDILDNAKIVEWTGSHTEEEYWECDDCYGEE